MVEAFCARLLEVRSGYDKPVGSRGWAYLLEGDGVIDKTEIDAAQKLINDRRKSGDLPLDFCAEDEKRAAANVEDIDADPQQRAAELFRYIKNAGSITTRRSGTISMSMCRWADDKSHLIGLFEDVCAEFNEPLSISSIGVTSTPASTSCFGSRRRRRKANAACCSTSATSIRVGTSSPRRCART